MSSKQVRSGRAPIVESAIRHFTERGYHGTSMRDIATGAGVTPASIYHHFTSKQQILQELMSGTMRDLGLATQTALAGAGSRPRDQLAAFAREWALFHTSRQPEALIGASELRSLEPEGRAEVVGLRDAQEAALQSVVDAGVASGEFATPHPVEATRAILTAGAALSSWFRTDGALSPEAMAEKFADLALATVQGPLT